MTGKFDLMNVNNMAFYISGPKLLFETTEISTHPNSIQQESNYIYLYTTKFGTSIKIRLNRKFESTEFETMRVNCIYSFKLLVYCFIYLLIDFLVLSHIQQYFSYIMVTSFSGGGSRVPGENHRPWASIW